MSGSEGKKKTSKKEIQMQFSHLLRIGRNTMPKPFTTVVPPLFKAASETYQ
jgi:hypothetical protein